MATRLLAPGPSSTREAPRPGAPATPRRPAGPAGPERARPRAWAWHSVALLAFLGAAFAARATVPEGGSLALTWPAAGVGCAWVFFARGRHRWPALVLLGAAAHVSNALTGADPGQAVAFGVSNVSQAVVFAVVLRRAAPGLWGATGREGLDDVRRLTWAVAASCAAAVTGATTGWLGFALAEETLAASTPLVWAGRNLAGILTVFAVVHLVGRRLTGHAEGAEPVSPRAVVLTGLATLAAYVPVFAVTTLPLSFLPVVATLWIGLRFPTVVTSVHALLACAVAVGATTAGWGPFALVPTSALQAVTVQLFACVVLLTGLFLSAARAERLVVLAALREEQRLTREQATLLESAVQAVSDGLLVVGHDGRILTRNARAAELLDLTGRRDVAAVGVTPMRRPDGSQVALGEGPAARALRGEVVHHEHVVLDDVDGFPRTFDVYAAPLDGGPDGAAALATFRDVTEELAQIDELSAFAGVVAHDLRGPMTTLLGWSEAARDLVEPRPGDLASEQLAALLGRIHASTARLDRMVGNLLLHATSRDRSLQRRPVDLRAVVAEVAETRGVADVAVAGDLPSVHGDPVLLHHLVDNLIGNAVKFARPEAPPRIRVHGTREGHEVRVGFSDNGIGVPAALRRRVFQRFERVPGTGLGGTGMGLSICQTIVERHGGDIHVEDGPEGVGSTFVVRLPAA